MKFPRTTFHCTRATLLPLSMLPWPLWETPSPLQVGMIYSQWHSSYTDPLSSTPHTPSHCTSPAYRMASSPFSSLRTFSLCRSLYPRSASGHHMESNMAALKSNKRCIKKKKKRRKWNLILEYFHISKWACPGVVKEQDEWQQIRSKNPSHKNNQLLYFKLIKFDLISVISKCTWIG